MEHDPHIRRLLLEQERLINLASRSEFIQIEPVELMPGLPPEKYVITFTCKGIARIDDQKAPVASRFHQVSMYISREFPRQEPHLKWLTPIWHPNIEHKEPYHVCTNNVQNSFSTKGLDELVLILGEMVQYRRYHAIWTQPWPYDKEVADWVINYAEPRGIVSRTKPFDDQPLLREYRIRVGGGEPSPLPPLGSGNRSLIKRKGIKFGGDKRGSTGSLSSEPVRKPGINFRPKRNS